MHKQNLGSSDPIEFAGSHLLCIWTLDFVPLMVILFRERHPTFLIVCGSNHISFKCSVMIVKELSKNKLCIPNSLI